MQLKIEFLDGEFTFIKNNEPDPQPIDVMTFDDQVDGQTRIRMITDTTRPWKSLYGFIRINGGEQIDFKEVALLGDLANEYNFDELVEVNDGGKYKYLVFMDDKNFDTNETDKNVPVLSLVADFGERLKLWFEVESVKN